MAWFRKMGADAVAYHEETVLGRDDDHPQAALDYYGTRGETPLRWGGDEAARLGLAGEVTPKAYRAVYGPGGFTDPATGERLTATKIPGFELVVSAHKSLAMLGVLGRADDMHSILDAETAGTMGHLESWMQASGGRRGRSATPTPTTGLVYAVTRHGTSRAGDPAPHDHVLIANYTHMLDASGGPKGLHSALVRDWAEAGAMAGRMRSAAKAIELGYAIEPDAGPSGRARDWAIVGVPAEVCEIFSKRADQIADYLDGKGYTGYRARNVAARQTRPVKRGTGVDELMPRWIAELEAVGWTVEELAAALDEARQRCAGLAPRLTDAEVDRLAADLLDPEGDFSARWKTFGRTRLIAEVAPLLYGHDPAELDQVVDRIITSAEVVPLIGVPASHEQCYATAAVLATEQAIAERVEHLATTSAPAVPGEAVAAATAAKEAEIGGPLSQGQRATIEAVCRSGRSVELVVGVAGAGKTTALDVAAAALGHAGRRVLGAATSGQAARTLGREAGIEARTMRSLLCRLDNHQLTLDPRTVVILDEAGMTADADLSRLLFAVERARAKVVLVGDPYQLSPVGPGGALAAVIARHPHIVTELVENKRQHDPAERAALAQLRDGDPDAALGYYLANDRVRVAPTREEALGAMVQAWAADVATGADTLLLAWQRSNVADLNRIARAHADHTGLLTGDDLVVHGGKPYAVGDPIVVLAPQNHKTLVTSQRGTVTHIDHQTQALTMATDDGRHVTLSGHEIDADHLDHAYALTVHRCQGATSDRTHTYNDGGGRQLAYVAMSRARERSTVHAVADDLDQAANDIAYDWNSDHAQHWITTTTEPGLDSRHQPDPATRHGERARRTAQALDDISRTLDRLDALQHRPPTIDTYDPPVPDTGLGL